MKFSGKSWCLSGVLLVLLMATGVGRLLGADVRQLGLGSHLDSMPPGVKGPPRQIHRTGAVTGKMPSNDWWSSLALSSNAFPHFAHPLAMKVEPAGLRLAYPGDRLRVDAKGIYGQMPGGIEDLLLGHSVRRQFEQPRVDGFSDWFVSLLFSGGEESLRLTYGHGSPFVFGIIRGGGPRVSFQNVPNIWARSGDGSTVGLTVNGRHYGLFGPAGRSWENVGTEMREMVCRVNGRGYFSVAVLPDSTRQTLELFGRFAHNHVEETSMDWRYDPDRSEVVARFRFEVRAMEGSGKGTLFALYPHQWKNSGQKLLPMSYGSVRGVMKLASGLEFTTRTRFNGVLPALPLVGWKGGQSMVEWLARDLSVPTPPVRDTYWDGKVLGRFATLIPIAEQHGKPAEAEQLRGRLKQRLEDWLSVNRAEVGVKDSAFFYYDELAGTLIGHPASYGSDTELNDHHFHYGYFIKAAAEVARVDPGWADESKWGGMIRLLVRDVVSADRKDGRFPFLRCFDPYAGHSWASGVSHYPDGNNNESSSEAMNAWCGLILWGEATGDRELRDLGICLFATENAAIQEYWFDAGDQNFPAEYKPEVVTMVWGGKGVHETWFSADPQLLHGINWLPVHGGSLYLGHSPGYAARNYRALVAARQDGDRFNNWADLIWMYRALSDSGDAVRLFEQGERSVKLEDGNSWSNLGHWIRSLEALGGPDPSVTADHPLHAVFRRGDLRTYVVWSMSERRKEVRFSDGQRLKIERRGPQVIRQKVR